MLNTWTPAQTLCACGSHTSCQHCHVLCLVSLTTSVPTYDTLCDISSKDHYAFSHFSILPMPISKFDPKIVSAQRAQPYAALKLSSIMPVWPFIQNTAECTAYRCRPAYN